jgi:hypothetical protein
MSKVVVQSKSEKKCRICQSGKRELWEAAYADYLNGVVDRVSGDRLTWPKLAERASVLSGSTLTVRSARRHADGHVRVVGEGRGAELEEQAEAGDELLDGVLSEIDGLLEAGSVSPTGLLSLQQRLYLLSLRDRLQRGDVPALTHDQAARASTATLTAAKRHQEADLLAALTGGIGAVFQKALGSAPAALEAGEVIEGEVIAEEDGAA